MSRKPGYQRSLRYQFKLRLYKTVLGVALILDGIACLFTFGIVNLGVSMQLLKEFRAWKYSELLKSKTNL